MEVGVFGGSFDPPHIGHLAVAQDVAEVLALDRMLFIPARRSPFKVEDPVTPAELRATMVEAALVGHPRFHVSRIEMGRPPPSFTVDTLEALTQQLPEARLTLVMGTDQWRAFAEWRDPTGILERARVAVMAREGEDPDRVGPDLPHRALHVRRMDVSSTEIRERVRSGRSIRYLVPEAVRRIIHRHELYGTDPAAETGGPVYSS